MFLLYLFLEELPCFPLLKLWRFAQQTIAFLQKTLKYQPRDHRTLPLLHLLHFCPNSMLLGLLYCFHSQHQAHSRWLPLQIMDPRLVYHQSSDFQSLHYLLATERLRYLEEHLALPIVLLLWT